MPGKHLDLDLDNNLGGDNPADVYIPSQKAIKTYVDGQVDTVNEKIDAIEIVDELAELQDTNISNAQDGQALTYNSTTQKWTNSTINTTTSWGDIQGTLNSQTDLKNALDGKADDVHTHVMEDITDLSIPSKTSELTNDSGFISSIPSEYITETELTTELQDYQTKITNGNKLSADLLSEGSTNKLVSASEKTTWNNKQNAINDLDAIRTGAGKGDTAVQPEDLHAVATSGDYNDLENKPTIPTVPTNVSAFTNDAGYLTNEDISSVFVYKGTKATVAELPTTGNKQGDVWTVTEDGAEYVWNGTSWEYLGEALDLSGYQTKITNTNKLSADLISDETTGNKFVSAADKVNWNSKQNALTQTQLDNIDAAGTALQPNDNISELNNDAGYLTEHQDISGKQDKIDATHKLSSDLVDDTNKTNKFVTETEKTTWNNKQNAISDIGTIRTNATAGKAAKDAVDAMGDIVSHDASEFQAAGDYAAEIHTHAISDVTNLQTTLDGKQASITSTNKLNADLLSEGTTNKLVSATEKSTWSGKQDALSQTQLDNITAAGTALQPNDNVSELTNDAGYLVASDIAGKADASNVYTKTEIDGKLSGAMHFKGSVANVEALPASGNTQGDMYNVTDTGANYAWDGSKWDKLSENIDLSGLQTKITNTSKLDADLVDDSSATHKFVTSGEKTTWNNKQNAIQDLNDIRNNATAGAEAATTIAGYGDIVTHDADEFLTEHQDISGKQDKITNSNKLSADLIQDGTTNKTVTATEKSTWSGKQDALSSTQIANIAKGGTAVQPGDLADVATSGSYNDLEDKPTIPTVPTNVSAFTNDAGYLTEHQSLDSKQDKITTTNKLSADLVQDGTTNKVVTATEKSTWNAKLDSSAISDMATKTWVGQQGYLTEHQDISGKANTDDLSQVAFTGEYTDLLNAPVDVSAFTNDAGYITGITSGDVTTALGYTPYDASNPNGYTNNAGTITGIKMNGTSKGTSGVVDLGTVITAHQDISGKANTADLADVAFSGDYNDLDNTPSVVTETTVSGWGFTKNAGTVTSVNNTAPVNGNVTINIPTVPTKVSAFTNDAGYLTAHQSLADYTKTEDLADVALSGSYNDLADKPTIPAAQVNSDWNATSGKAQILNKPSIPSQPSDIGAAAATHDHTSSQITDLSTTISTAIAGKADSATSLSGYGITDAYTKTEIDGMVASGMHYKGTKASASALPTTGNQIGDLWNVTDTGANYAWNGTAWDKLSENIDLSGYVPTSRTVNGKALTGNISLTASDVGALPSTTSIPTKTSDLTNDDGFITSADLPTKVSDLTNDSGFISGITGTDVTTALGYTPYNSTNPNGYTSNKGTVTKVNNTSPDANGNVTISIPSAVTESTVSGWGFTKNTGTITGITMNGSSKGTSGVIDLGTVLTAHQDISGKQDAITSTNKLSADLISNGTTNKVVTQTEKNAWDAKLDSSAISDMATQTWVGNQGYITGITGSDVTTALGYTPYNSSNPSGYITSSALPTNLSDLTDDLGSNPTHTHSQYLTSVTAHNQASNTINAMTGYTKASASAAIAATDTLNQALGKLEYKADIAASGSVTVGQLNGPRITPSNPTVPVSVSGSTVTINGVDYTSGDLVTAILAGTAPTELEIVTHSNLRCYVYNNAYYRRDTLAAVA